MAVPDKDCYATVYTCRRCKRTYEGHVGTRLRDSAIRGLHRMSDGMPLERFNGVPVALFEVHECKDGGIGLSDLIGMNSPDTRFTR